MAAGLSFAISADTKNFTASLKRAEKHIGSFSDKVRKVSFGNLSKGANKAANSLSQFSKTNNTAGLTAMVKTLRLLSRGLNRASKPSNLLNKGLARLAVGGARAAKGSVLLLGYAARGTAKSLISMARAAALAGGAAMRGLKNITFGALKMGAVAATAAVAGLSLALKKSVAAASNLEMLEVQFSSITGSAKDGAAMVAHLREESKRTGVEIGGLGTMTRRLIASGMDVGASQKMTSSLLDISGALGLSNEEAKLLGIAISQVASKGVVSMEELRQQIAEKGVPVFDVMADKLNVTKGEFMKMVADGKVGSEVLIEAFSNLEGPLAKFKGGAERMAATTTGAFRRMKAQMADTFAEAGKPLLDGLASVVNKITTKIKEWGPMIKGWTTAAGEFAGVIGAAFSSGELGGMIKLSLVIAAKEMINTLWAGVKALAGFVGIYLVEGVQTAWSKVMDMSFWKGVMLVLKSGAQWLEVAALKIAAAIKPWQNFENAIESRTQIAKGLASAGMLAMGEAGDGRGITDILVLAAEAAAEEYREALKDPLMKTKAQQKELATLYDKMKAAAEALAAAAATASSPASIEVASFPLVILDMSVPQSSSSFGALPMYAARAARLMRRWSRLVPSPAAAAIIRAPSRATTTTATARTSSSWPASVYGTTASRSPGLGSFQTARWPAESTRRAPRSTTR